MQLTKLKLAELTPYYNNPRNNDGAVDAVAESIKQCSYIAPIIVDEDLIILAGHTRYKALEKLGIKEAEVIVKEGLSDEQKRKYRILDNKTNELAEWDFEKLEKELEGLDFGDFDFGFDAYDDELLDLVKEDFFEEPEIEEPTTRAGQIFQLGNHRLMCGDSTRKKDVDLLMSKEKADLCITDPPYNVNYESIAGKIENDNLSDAEFRKLLDKAFANIERTLKEGAAFYVWYASKEAVNFNQALKDAGLEVHQQLIWVKNQLVLGRQDYQWKHEPCLYGWKPGASHYFSDSRIETTVIDDKPNIARMSKEQLKDYIKDLWETEARSTVIYEDKPSQSAEHPTMKPVKMLARFIKNSSRQDDIVTDFFGGSGSTMIACEQLNRRCYMMEYDPKYCDVIIKRWEEFTGQKAKLIK